MYSRKRLIYSFIIALFLTSIPWIIEIASRLQSFDWRGYGLKPHNLNGLTGILTMPFLHGSLQHLISNSVPFLILGSALFFFYSKVAWRTLFFVLILTGVILWFIGNEGTNHIGASGVVYGLVTFHLTNGFIRKNRNLMAFSLLVVFLYGGFIWSLFPEFFPDKNISWEGHLAGAISGLAMAIVFGKHGPPPDPILSDDDEQDNEEEYNIPEGGQNFNNLPVEDKVKSSEENKSKNFPEAKQNNYWTGVNYS